MQMEADGKLDVRIAPGFLRARQDILSADIFAVGRHVDAPRVFDIEGRRIAVVPAFDQNGAVPVAPFGAHILRTPAQPAVAV